MMTLMVMMLPTFAIDTPKDVGTIEALIRLHKLIKGAEEDALAQVTASYGEQSLITKGATKYNDVRSTLDSKLNNAYSYVILGASLAGTGTDLYKLIDTYSKFTSSTTKSMFHKPMVAWYYAEANYACSREIKNIKKMYVTIAASGINLMKASMDEKLDMINELRGYIRNMQGIIDQAYAWCSIVVTGGFHYDYIWDILNSEVTDAIAKGLIDKWFGDYDMKPDRGNDVVFVGDMEQVDLDDWGNNINDKQQQR